MKPNFSKIVVLVLLIAFLATTSASPTSAQTPDPPVIMENGEFLQDLYLDQAITERIIATVEGGENGINAAYTWWSASGTVFVPSTSTITYNYGGAGCLDTSANYDFWRGIVNLPHGSTILGMYFNYANEVADPTDSYIYLRRYRYNGDFDDLIYVSGSYTGVGNHTHWIGTVTNPVVNNYDYAYVLVWGGMTQQQLCGVNLSYTPPPLFLSALPMIKR